MRRPWILGALTIGVVACAGGPTPGSPYDAGGAYSGRLSVQREEFDADLELRTQSDGRVGGSFAVGPPFGIEGRVDGRIVDDVLRVTITYQSASKDGCDGRIEGILDIRAGRRDDPGARHDHGLPRRAPRQHELPPLNAEDGNRVRRAGGAVTMAAGFGILAVQTRSLPPTTSLQDTPMRTRTALPLALLALVASACGQSQDQSDTSTAGGAAASTPATPALVRTADPAARGYAESDFPRVQEVAPGVYTYEALRSFGSARLATVSLFVVTDDGVLVAGGVGSPAEAQALLDHISQVTDQPVSTVVVTSSRPDRTDGNSAFPSGVTFLAHPATAAALSERGGAPAISQTVDDERDLTMGGREIHVQFLGRAYTNGDLAVSLPTEKVLYLGDVFMNHVFPDLSTGYPRDWVATIERAQGMDVDRYLPGRGFVDPPAAAADELDSFRGAIQVIIDETSHPVSEGAGVEDALARVQLGLDDWSLADSLREPAIRRVYLDLNGSLLAR